MLKQQSSFRLRRGPDVHEKCLLHQFSVFQRAPCPNELERLLKLIAHINIADILTLPLTTTLLAIVRNTSIQACLCLQHRKSFWFILLFHSGAVFYSNEKIYSLLHRLQMCRWRSFQLCHLHRNN